MADTSYEVMVLSPITTGTMRRDTWYLESAHTLHAEAWRHFQTFSGSHPDRRLLVALIQSSYDEASGRFRDRVIEARDAVVPSFARGALPLPPEARKALGREFGKPLPPELGRAKARRKAGGPPRRFRAAHALLWVAVAAVLALAGLGALRLTSAG